MSNDSEGNNPKELTVKQFLLKIIPIFHQVLNGISDELWMSHQFEILKLYSRLFELEQNVDTKDDFQSPKYIEEYQEIEAQILKMQSLVHGENKAKITF